MNTLWEEENSIEATVKSEKCTESINGISMNEIKNVSKKNVCENTGLTRKCPKCNITIVYKNTQICDRQTKLGKLCRSCVQVQENRPNTRNCPKCNKILIYKDPCQRAKFEVLGLLCLSCSHIKPIINLSRKCPTCGENILYKRPQALRRAEKENRGCMKCRANKLTKIMVERMKDPINFGKTFLPGYNEIACEYFDWLNKWMKWDGQYALHKGEKNVLNYFVDYYEPHLNVIIEWDEKNHRRKKSKEKDLVRQNRIKEHLGCKFYRVNDLTLEMKEV